MKIERLAEDGTRRQEVEGSRGKTRQPLAHHVTHTRRHKSLKRLGLVPGNRVSYRSGKRELGLARRCLPDDQNLIFQQPFDRLRQIKGLATGVSEQPAAEGFELRWLFLRMQHSLDKLGDLALRQRLQFEAKQARFPLQAMQPFQQWFGSGCPVEGFGANSNKEQKRGLFLVPATGDVA